MTGRGRGFSFKKPEFEEKPSDEQSEIGSTLSTTSSFPILGRGGRGVQVRSQIVNPQQSTDSSDVESSVSAFPLLGRGRGMLAAGRLATTSDPSSDVKTSESDQIELVKQFTKGQFDDLPSPQKKVSDSSGRGRSSGKFEMSFVFVLS